MLLKVSLIGIKLKHVSFLREIGKRRYLPCHLAKEVISSRNDPANRKKRSRM